MKNDNQVIIVLFMRIKAFVISWFKSTNEKTCFLHMQKTKA